MLAGMNEERPGFIYFTGTGHLLEYVHINP